MSLEVQKFVARALDVVPKELLPDPSHKDLYLGLQFQLLHLGLSLIVS